MAVYRLNLNHNRTGNDRSIYSLHYWTADPDLDIAETVGEAYIDFLNDNTADPYPSATKTLFPSQMSFVGITGAQVDVDPSPVVEWLPSSPVAMTGTAAVSPQLAIVISKRTGTAGRSYRGRTYIGPLATAAIANTGRTATGVATTLSARWMRHMANGVLPSAAVYNEVVWSRTLQTFTQINSWIVNDVVDTQRRRAFSQ